MAYPKLIHFYQLRAKSKNNSEYLEIYRSLKNKFNLNIIINDRWDLAIGEKAFGLHLGKEDYENLDSKTKIEVKNFDSIKGISSHSKEDVLNLEHFWTYSGIGPIFPTQTKKVSYPPLGINQLNDITKISPIPLVAIGGISLENLSNIAKIRNVVPASISLFSQIEVFSEIVKIWSENIA